MLSGIMISPNKNPIILKARPRRRAPRVNITISLSEIVVDPGMIVYVKNSRVIKGETWVRVRAAPNPIYKTPINLLKYGWIRINPSNPALEPHLQHSMPPLLKLPRGPSLKNYVGWEEYFAEMYL